MILRSIPTFNIITKKNIDGYYILSKKHSAKLNAITVKQIENAIATGDIYNCENFAKIMYWWDNLAGIQDLELAKKFCKNNISEKKFVIKCAQSFISVLDEPITPKKMGTIYRGPKVRIPFYISNDQVGKLLNVDQLREYASKFHSDVQCRAEEKTILEKLLKAPTINGLG